MSSSGRVLRIWLIVLLIGSVFAVLRRPLDQLGYDLAVAVALAAGLILPNVAAARAADYRRSGDARRSGPIGFVMGFFAQMFLMSTAVLMVPLGVVLVRGFFGGHCDFTEGLLWYVTISGVSALYASAVGMFFGLVFRNVGLATAVSYVFLIGGFLLTARHVITDPPVFFFDHVLGYVPGPIYDERVSFVTPFLWARVGTLAWIGVLLCLTASIVNTRRTQLEPLQLITFDFSLEGLLPRAGLVVGVVTLLTLHAYRQETGVAPTASSIQKALGGRVESENFVIYYSPARTDSTEATRLVQDHEFRLAQILRTLELERRPLESKITSYVYPDPETKKALMGARNTSFADPFNLAMHLNAASFPHPVLKHELVHVISSAYAPWPGFNPRIGLHEGLAVAVDWEEEELTPHEWSAIMRGAELLPDLSSLTGMAFWRQPPTRAYLATGSFLRHLLDTHGAGAVLAFFGDTDYEKHFGKPFEELEADWLRAIDRVRIEPERQELVMARLQRGAIFDRRCPRRVAELATSARRALVSGRDEDALESYDRILALTPGDDAARVGKLRSLIALERDEEAVALGHAILGERDTGPTVAVARDLLGNNAWRAGRTEEAREHFTANLSGGAPDDLVRAAEVKLAVLEESEYRDILAGASPSAEDIATLTNLTIWGPERSLARYLLGRRLYRDGAWSSAETNLREAVASQLPGERVRPEALRLLGDTRYRLGDDAGAEAAFAELAAIAGTEAEAVRAHAWVNRTRWHRGLEMLVRDVAPEDPPAGLEDDAASEVTTIAEEETAAPADAAPPPPAKTETNPAPPPAKTESDVTPPPAKIESDAAPPPAKTGSGPAPAPAETGSGVTPAPAETGSEANESATESADATGSSDATESSAR